MAESVNKIIERKYYAVKLKLISPLCVSGGTDINTDADILRNKDNEVFVPGSSMAGAFRGYAGCDKESEGPYGFSKGEEGRMSAIFVSDMYFNKKPSVNVRDGVRLTGDKTVDNKFDMEIIETGAEGILFLETVSRQDDSWDLDKEIVAILQGLASGEIRFGANKSRGYGRCQIIEVGRKCFKSEEWKEWIEFVPCRKDPALYDPANELIPVSPMGSEYIHVRVPLRLKGGISIRKYSVNPGKADYEHITCNGKPVIPGTSWNGAVRADIRHILERLGRSQKEISETLWTWFGWTKEDIKGDEFKKWLEKSAERLKTDKEKLGAEQSLIVLSESVISGAASVPITRNKVSRFSSSVIDSALYSEISSFGGETYFEYMIKKDADRGYLALAAVMDMVTKDIQEGIVPVGGLVSVGRGIFEEDPEKQIVYSETIPVSEAQNALYELINAEAI